MVDGDVADLLICCPVFRRPDTKLDRAELLSLDTYIAGLLQVSIIECRKVNWRLRQRTLKYQFHVPFKLPLQV